MATTTSSLVFLKSPIIAASLPSDTTILLMRNGRFQPGIRTTRRRTKPNNIKAQVDDDVRKEDVVVVGAGIAGLATALSLHRLQVATATACSSLIIHCDASCMETLSDYNINN